MALALTHYDPQDGHPDDWIADKADKSMVTFCFYELAYFTGNDEMGDKGWEAFETSAREDDFGGDEIEECREYLKLNLTRPSQWLAVLRDEVAAIEDGKRRLAAKRAVWRFIAGLFA